VIRILLRLIVIASVTTTFGWVLNKSVSAADRSPGAAGFGRGVLHGALMPGAMPSLFFGRDVVIYATNNNGRLYKLGYTFGVNACGAFFFGMSYWRLSRWRKRFASLSEDRSQV
jgi:hypothetical protein